MILASPTGGGGPRKRWWGCTFDARTLPQSAFADSPLSEGAKSASAALAAPAVEGQVAVIHHGVRFPGGCGVQLLRDMHPMQVADGPAAGADEVDMGIDVAVVALDTVDGAQAADQPLLLEQGDVAVDRPEGQVRDLRLQARVHRFSRRMLVGGPQVG